MELDEKTLDSYWLSGNYRITMAAISVLTKEEWQEVRSAVEAGVPMKDVAERHEIELETLIKRAQREKWLTQTAREKALRLHQAKMADNRAMSSQRPARPSAIETVIATRAENVEMTKDAAIRWGRKVFEHAEQHLSTPKTFKDVRDAGEVVAKMAGFGQEASVQVNLWGSLNSANVRTVEAETTPVSSPVHGEDD